MPIASASFLNGRFHHLLGRLVEAGVDDLHAGVAQRAGDDLRPPVVPVEADLRNHHPYSVFHNASILTRPGTRRFLLLTGEDLTGVHYAVRVGGVFYGAHER